MARRECAHVSPRGGGVGEDEGVVHERVGGKGTGIRVRWCTSGMGEAPRTGVGETAGVSGRARRDGVRDGGGMRGWLMDGHVRSTGWYQL